MNEEERRYSQGLYEIAAAVNSAHTLDGVLSTIAESVTRALDAKGCSLMLLSSDRKELLHIAAHGLSDSYGQKGTVFADKSIAEVLRGTAVIILDATEDERVQYREEARREGIASILSVPMMLKGEIVGVVRVYTAGLRHFTADDTRFAEAVANLGAIALENAKLYESLEKDNETLRSELLEWRAVMGVWPPRLAHRR